MSKQSQVSIPLSLITAGEHGPFTSGFLPTDLAGYIVDLQNDVTWPLSGDVCTITVEQSNDAGNTWIFDASITLVGGLWKTLKGLTINTASWNVQFDNQGSATRKVRARLTALQICTLGATLSSL